MERKAVVLQKLNFGNKLAMPLIFSQQVFRVEIDKVSASWAESWRPPPCIAKQVATCHVLLDYSSETSSVSFKERSGPRNMGLLVVRRC